MSLFHNVDSALVNPNPAMTQQELTPNPDPDTVMLSRTLPMAPFDALVELSCAVDIENIDELLPALSPTDSISRAGDNKA